MTTSVLNVYSVQSYTTGVKDVAGGGADRDQKPESRFQRMRERYEREGLRRSVGAVLLAHQHNHPVVLLLEDANASNGGLPSPSSYHLPGGRTAPGEDEIAGLIRRLDQKLRPPPCPPPEADPDPDPVGTASTRYEDPHWEVREPLACWWRPHFDSHVYPYLPVHVTKPVELTHIFSVALPPKCALGVPKNLKLISVPLYDLYANEERFGPIIASIPQIISRFNLVFI